MEMAIRIEPLQKAFALASKLAHTPDIDMEQRKNYRLLESLISTAFGEEMEAPETADELKTRLIAVNEQMEKIAPRCDWSYVGQVTDATLNARAEYSKLLREASEIVVKLGY